MQLSLLFLFILGALSIPTTYIHALPPPDLILSIPQAFLHMLGALTASLVIAGGSFVAFVNYLRQRPLKSGVLFVSIAGLLILSIIGGLALHNRIRIEQWKTDIDAEYKDIWELYEPVYSAYSEVEAQKDLRRVAKIVTWDEFVEDTANQDYVIVDIRDTYSYELGHIPGSIHIRLAELIKGDWEKITEYKDKPVLLICYLGTTGILASQFLESKGFTNTYQLRDGIIESYSRDESLPFEGISFLPATPKTTTRISHDAAAKFAEDSVKVIDVRAPSRYTERVPYPASHHMFREKMTQAEIDDWIKTNLSHDERYLLVCEGGGSCFSAVMLVFDLGRMGYDTVGITDINTPDGERGYDYQLPPYDTLTPLP